MTAAGTRRLLRRLFDDAALFPPGNAPMVEAVPAHRRHRGAWYRDLVGPFICPDRRIEELQDVLTIHGEEGPPVEVSLLVTVDGDALTSALAAVGADQRLDLAGVEARVQAGSDIVGETAEVVTALAAEVDIDVPAYIELPAAAGVERGLDVVADSGRRAKLRTGGETAGAFPSEAQVAAFILACIERKVAFKCTAGLHDAVRHTDPVTGFEHHGYLNIALALHVGLQRPSLPVVQAVLAERDGAALAEQVTALDGDAAEAVRRSFVSFGTCSVTDPIEDAVALGVLATPY